MTKNNRSKLIVYAISIILMAAILAGAGERSRMLERAERAMPAKLEEWAGDLTTEDGKVYICYGVGVHLQESALYTEERSDILTVDRGAIDRLNCDSGSIGRENDFVATPWGNCSLVRYYRPVQYMIYAPSGNPEDADAQLFEIVCTVPRRTYLDIEALDTETRDWETAKEIVNEACADTLHNICIATGFNHSRFAAPAVLRELKATPSVISELARESYWLKFESRTGEKSGYATVVTRFFNFYSVLGPREMPQPVDPRTVDIVEQEG